MSVERGSEFPKPMRFLSYLRWQKGRTVRQVTSLRRGLVSPRGVPRSTPSDGSLNTVAESGAYTPGAWHPLWQRSLQSIQ